MRMCHTHRRIFAQLVQQLLAEGKNDKAQQALEYAEKVLPAYNIPYDWQNGAAQLAESWYRLGNQEKGDEIIQALADKAVEYCTWYLSLDERRFMLSVSELEYNWALLDAVVKVMRQYQSPLADIYTPKVDEIYNLYMERME